MDSHPRTLPTLVRLAQPAVCGCGEVVAGGETYIISVYSRQTRYDWSRVEHVCALAAQALV